MTVRCPSPFRRPMDLQVITPMTAKTSCGHFITTLWEIGFSTPEGGGGGAIEPPKTGGAGVREKGPKTDRTIHQLL